MAKTTKRKSPAKGSVQERAKQALKSAQDAAARSATWQDAYNQLYSSEGEISELFPLKEDRLAFLKTPQADEIRKILAELRLRDAAGNPTAEEMSIKFLLRMPRSLHAALEFEAEAEGVSMTQLMLLKLTVGLKESLSKK